MSGALRSVMTYAIVHPCASTLAAVVALELRPGQRLLDAGCGPGARLGRFAARVAPGRRVVGLDRNADRLALAAEQGDGTARLVPRLLRGARPRLLPPRDWAHLAALFDQDSPHYLPAPPDFFMART